MTVLGFCLYFWSGYSPYRKLLGRVDTVGIHLLLSAVITFFGKYLFEGFLKVMDAVDRQDPRKKVAELAAAPAFVTIVAISIICGSAQ